LFGAGVGKAAEAVAARKAAQGFAKATQGAIDRTPETTALSVYRRAYNEAGLPHLAPAEITPETAATAKTQIGQMISSIYKKMTFDPNAPGWSQNVNAIRKEIEEKYLSDPAIAAKWHSAVDSETLNPAFWAGRGNPITGEKLNQIISDMTKTQNEWGLLAQKGGDSAGQFGEMAKGLQKIRDTMIAQMSARDPKLASQLKGANRGYFLADTMQRATSAKTGGVPNKVEDIIGSLEKKLGKQVYGETTRMGILRRNLDEARKAQKERVPIPADKEKGTLRKVIENATAVPGAVLGYEAGKLVGHPIMGSSVGASIARGAVPLIEKGAGRLPPGAAGAAGGQAARLAPKLDFKSWDENAP
jgi:hypothetical protein